MNDKQLANMRHSLAHILAYAVQDLYEDVKFGVGPVIDNGFYYDFDLPDTISKDDLIKVEKRMKHLIKQNLEFEREDVGLDQAKGRVKRDQPYKLELIEDLETKGTTDVYTDAGGQETGVDSVSFYTIGDFTDLCRGGHVNKTGEVGAFTLTRVSGAYWRGDENNNQMQRIYGVAFETQEELDEYLKMQEEAKERDHRKLGQKLDLFISSELVGSGLPLFTQRGTWLRQLLGRYTQQLRANRGFERVWTPHMTKNDLYKKSGHWEKFGDELFLVTSQETSDDLVLKPMNCPHHTQIYESQQRSYRDLPIRMMENTTDYRDEKSGELHGLSRVRSLTQDDSHVFCLPEQIEVEATSLIKAAQEMYAELDMNLSFDLSFRDSSSNYLGDETLWQEAQQALKDLAEKNELAYRVVEGEAAFYGPKIDFIATDAIGRDWQVATVQLDFVQPRRFELEYVDEEGQTQTPVMIHCALLGTIERFLSVYIEHTNGHFPFWLAPEQIRILTINDQVDDYVKEITTQLSEAVLMEPLKYNELRWTIDSRNESLGKKIREARNMRVPVLFIVGPKDEAKQVVSVKVGDDEQTVQIDKLQKFIITEFTK